MIAIRGGRPLGGRTRTSGAKNAALPAVVASLLTEEPLVLKGVPKLLDVETQLLLVEALGKRVSWHGDELRIEGEVRGWEAPAELVSRMRASFLCLGPLLARLGRAKVPLPGGCVIGARPVDLHIGGLRRLGAEVEVRDGTVTAWGRLRGGTVWLRYPSVGATEHLLLCAATLPEPVEIVNPAREPEVMDLCRLLSAMGAEVEVGPERITVCGSERLGGTEHRVIPDRIEAGTYLLAGAATGGEVRVEGLVPEHLHALTAVLGECGVGVRMGEDWIEVRGRPRRGIEVATAPYPGFPTDLQPPLTALLSVAEGRSVVRETVFEARFGHVGELLRMGARIALHGQSIVVEGAHKLQGARVRATDIRAGAALVIAGLAAEGETLIEGVEHIRRGYENIIGKLAGLGAEVWEGEANGI